MQQRTGTTITALLVVGALIAACASSEEAPVSEQPAVADASPSIKVDSGSSSTPEASTAKDCSKLVCKTDNECQTSCDTKQSSLWCCETGSGTCFSPGDASTCPVPNQNDSGSTAY